MPAACSSSLDTCVYASCPLKQLIATCVDASCLLKQLDKAAHEQRFPDVAALHHPHQQKSTKKHTLKVKFNNKKNVKVKFFTRFRTRSFHPPCTLELFLVVPRKKLTDQLYFIMLQLEPERDGPCRLLKQRQMGIKEYK
jgi:hypothetical protein